MSSLETTRWLARGAELVRVGPAAIDAVVEHRGWLAELLGERGGLPPAGLIIDVGRLLGGAHLEAAQLPEGEPDLRAALRSYEDQLLGRLCMSPLFDSLVDAFAPLGPDLRCRALAAVLGRLLDRVGFCQGAPVRASLLRRVSAEMLLDSSAPDLDVEASLLAAYDALATGARRAPALLDATDAFVVEHIAVLGDLGQRLAVEQISEAATELGRALPRMLKGRDRDRDRDPTQLVREDMYPVGGFASMSTSGKMENLVISELAYMDDDADLDLFDLRYAEGELLFYTRDDSLYHRGHRAIRVALLPDLARARVKDASARWQRIVSACGLLAALVDRLVAWLETRALDIRVVFVEPAGVAPLDERALIEILLGDWIERGVVSIETAGSLAEVAAAAEEGADLGDSALVVLTCNPERRLPEVERVESATLYLDRAAPRLVWVDRPGRTADADEDRPPPWREVAIELLSELL